MRLVNYFTLAYKNLSSLNILYYNETTVAVTIKMIGVSIVNLFFTWFSFAEQLKAGVNYQSLERSECAPLSSSPTFPFLWEGRASCIPCTPRSAFLG